MISPIQKHVKGTGNSLTGALYISAEKGRKNALLLKQSIFSLLWCGRRDLNPYGVTHTPLKRARLPVPPRPRPKGLFIILICVVSVKYQVEETASKMRQSPWLDTKMDC